MESQPMFPDCPAYGANDGAARRGLPAEAELRCTVRSTGGPLARAKIRCPRGHWFNGRPDPTFALPLAGGRGYWVIGIMTQSDTYSAPAALRTMNWPDGSQVATPRPVIVHHETDTFTTTYTGPAALGQRHRDHGRLLRLATRGQHELNPDHPGGPGHPPAGNPRKSTTGTLPRP